MPKIIKSGEVDSGTFDAYERGVLDASESMMDPALERAEIMAEPQLVELVGAIAARILQREARTDRDLVGATVRRVLDRLFERERLVVRVNPLDLDALRDQKVTLLEEFDGVRQLDVIADESVGPGGCVVESKTLFVDAQLDAQLGRILDELRV